MDLFIEEIVKHKRTNKEMLMVAGIVTAAIILLMLSTLLTNIRFVASFWFFIAIAIVYAAFVLIRNTNVEYEYILTNSDLDIDKIIARRSRKRVAEISLNHIEIMAPLWENENDQNIKVIDCTGNRQTTVYKIDMFKDSEKIRVLFQPTDKIIESAKRFNPSKVIVG